MKVENVIAVSSNRVYSEDAFNHLLQFVQRNDIRAVERQLPLVPQELLDQRDGDNETLLTLALYRGNKEIALTLIERMSVDQLTVSLDEDETVLQCAIVSKDYDAALAIVEKLPSEVLLKKAGQFASHLHLALFFGAKYVLLRMIQKLSPEDIAQLDGVTGTQVPENAGDSEPFIHKLLREQLCDAPTIPSMDGVHSNAEIQVGRTVLQEIYRNYFSKISIFHLTKTDSFGKTPVTIISERSIPGLESLIFHKFTEIVPPLASLIELRKLGIAPQGIRVVERLFNDRSILFFLLQHGSDHFIEKCWFSLRGYSPIFDKADMAQDLLEKAISRRTETVALLFLTSISFQNLTEAERNRWMRILTKSQNATMSKVHAAISYQLQQASQS